jgi:hypothetical protein
LGKYEFYARLLLYTAEVEPDRRQGWCEVCGTTTVQSGIVLAGLI